MLSFFSTSKNGIYLVVFHIREQHPLDIVNFHILFCTRYRVCPCLPYKYILPHALFTRYRIRICNSPLSALSGLPFTMFEVQLLSKVILFTLVSRWLNIHFQLSFFIYFPPNFIAHNLRMCVFLSPSLFIYLSLFFSATSFFFFCFFSIDAKA